MNSERDHEDIRVWIDPDCGIAIKAVTFHGNPVELSTPEARQLADALIRLAVEYESEEQPAVALRETQQRLISGGGRRRLKPCRDGGLVGAEWDSGVQLIGSNGERESAVVDSDGRLDAVDGACAD